ncbi:MAG TPA: cell division protein ZapE [Amaricoccus sp.]|nr:cell division protein ZapE [Amaricoccus sp.]
MALYRKRVAEGALDADPAQRLAVEKLQLLAMRLADYNPAKPKRVGLGLFGWGRERIEERPVPGLYLYGGVGRGKSMLMDLFFEAAPVSPKRRVHFHAFMQEVHRGIASAREKGVSDPVRPVADKIADGATLLCFDEMQISDITDAMLVGRLFERLFERGVVVVTTSNRAPDELYKDGLNRNLFLPFIAMLKDRLEVHELASLVDHRLDFLHGEAVYHTPLGPAATAALDAAWTRLAGGPGAPLTLTVQGHAVALPRFRNKVARAAFADLCSRPLGPADFLAIAEAVEVLILDDVPALSKARSNEAKRFVTLIDTLYEAKVRLVCSAAAPPEALYQEGEGAFEFARTASRLHEMQAAEWGRGARQGEDAQVAHFG